MLLYKGAKIQKFKSIHTTYYMLYIYITPKYTVSGLVYTLMIQWCHNMTTCLAQGSRTSDQTRVCNLFHIGIGTSLTASHRSENNRHY